MLEVLRDLPSRVLGKLSPAECADPQVGQEVGRLALSALAAGS